MRAGRALRQQWAMEAAEKIPCSGCGHPPSRHREYQPTYEIRGGEIITVEHPRYKPALFHCEVEGCRCEVQR